MAPLGAGQWVVTVPDSIAPAPLVIRRSAMELTLDALAREAGVDPAHPALARERDFLAHWCRALLDPKDPQRARWLRMELEQIARNEAIAAEVARFVALDGAAVLDLGCQLGALPIALAARGARVTGVDVDAALLEAAALRVRGHGASVTLVRAVGEALPFDDARFDAVTFIDVIEHVDDPRKTLRELARVLRPGGTLYLFGPNRLSPTNLRADPHYQLAGVSAMPRALGRWYVTRVRGFPRYDVGVLPVGGLVARWLAADGLRVTHSAADDADAWWRARAPSWAAGGARAARLWGHARTSLASLFRLVAVKG